MKPKVMIVQKSVEYNDLSGIENYFKIAKDNNCDFILFPEYTHTEVLVETYNHEKTKNFKEGVQELANKYSVYAVLSVLDKLKNRMYNVAYLINRKGDVVGSHKKIALERYYEKKVLKPGKELNVFDTEFGKVGILLCRDLLYPQLSKKLSDKGAKIIFCPTYWQNFSTAYFKNATKVKTRFPVNADLNYLKIIPQARAMECELFVLVANAVGIYRSGSYVEYLAGYSSVCSPIHGTLQVLDNHDEGFIIQELDFDILEDSKDTFAVRRNRPKN